MDDHEQLTNIFTICKELMLFTTSKKLNQALKSVIETNGDLNEQIDIINQVNMIHATINTVHYKSRKMAMSFSGLSNVFLDVIECSSDKNIVGSDLKKRLCEKLQDRTRDFEELSFAVDCLARAISKLGTTLSQAKNEADHLEKPLQFNEDQNISTNWVEFLFSIFGEPKNSRMSRNDTSEHLAQESSVTTEEIVEFSSHATCLRKRLENAIKYAKKMTLQNVTISGQDLTKFLYFIVAAADKTLAAIPTT